MKVGELIEALKVYNPDQEAVCFGRNEQLLKIQAVPFEIGSVDKVSICAKGLLISGIEDMEMQTIKPTDYVFFAKFSDLDKVPVGEHLQLILQNDKEGVVNEYEIIPAIFNGFRFNAEGKSDAKIPNKIIVAWRSL